jgi:hypothetical protein
MFYSSDLFELVRNCLLFTEKHEARMVEWEVYAHVG